MHRFLLPALLGDNAYPPGFVSYFQGPIEEIDDWTSIDLWGEPTD